MGTTYRLIPKKCEGCGAMFQPKELKSRFCTRRCVETNGRKHLRRGCRHVRKNGYILLIVWEGDNQRHVLEHRYVMEQHLGRRLKPAEHVHHKNGNKQDNRLENLEVLSNAEHQAVHREESRVRSRKNAHHLPNVVKSALGFVRVCSIPGCERNAMGRGLCNTHHRQVWRKERNEGLAKAAAGTCHDHEEGE